MVRKIQSRKLRATGRLTGDTGEQLPSELLDMSAWEGHELIALEKVKDTLAQ